MEFEASIAIKHQCRKRHGVENKSYAILTQVSNDFKTSTQ